MIRILHLTMATTMTAVLKALLIPTLTAKPLDIPSMQLLSVVPVVRLLIAIVGVDQELSILKPADVRRYLDIAGVATSAPPSPTAGSKTVSNEEVDVKMAD